MLTKSASGSCSFPWLATKTCTANAAGEIVGTVFACAGIALLARSAGEDKEVRRSQSL